MEIPWIAIDQPAAGPTAVVMASKFELKSSWRSPAFLVHSLRLRRQARRSPGVLGVSLRAEPLKGTFWTLSAWTDRKALSGYSRTNPHDKAKAKIRPWMEDSTFVFWEAPAAELPKGPKSAGPLWADGERRISASKERGTHGTTSPTA